jgi:UDP-2-acetamido-2,6-beta-L-arabino-hexul-4-ose reductase
MRIAISGATGFIGSNLRVRLAELGHQDLVLLPHQATPAQLHELLKGVRFVFHLAGVNRPRDPQDYLAGNSGFTRLLCEAMSAQAPKPDILFSSSTQAAGDSVYGQSKRAAEQQVLDYAGQHGVRAHLFRLTNVFGKWSRPNYNSAVATFCHNVARDLPITVHDPRAPLRLVHVDDVLNCFIQLLQHGGATGLHDCGPEYETTVGEVAALIQSFKDSRETLMSTRVGSGLVRALYATYVSFLPADRFAYQVARHSDPRGVFVEMLKTPDSGQFSYFTAHPGVTRGEHYHHAKTEKFLVIKGRAHFGFRHIVTQERHELIVEGGDARIVETAPGWTHNITNIGNEELIVMLWANEVFDRARPDTVAMPVNPT